MNLFQLWRFAMLFLKHPLLILPTVRATKRTFEICNEQFGNAHNKSNASNAFRHVLWNMLICKNSLKRTKNKQKSVFWAQKIGDLYEKATRNKPLDEAMDIHNNTVGRIYFLNLIDKNEQEMVDFALEKMNDAQHVIKIEEMKRFYNKMIFIEN